LLGEKIAQLLRGMGAHAIIRDISEKPFCGEYACFYSRKNSKLCEMAYILTKVRENRPKPILFRESFRDNLQTLSVFREKNSFFCQKYFQAAARIWSCLTHVFSRKYS
jgi:hypothetical protein